MQIKISARHGSVSEATQAKITRKVERLTRFFERLTAIEVTVNLENRDWPNVDIRVSAEHKHDFVAGGQADELMAAIDVAIHKIEQQLRKYKEKLQDRHRGPGHRQQTTPSDSGQGGS